MIVLLPCRYIVGKIAVMEDRLCITDVEKAVSLQGYIFQMGELSI